MRLALCALVALIVAGCATSSVQSRRQERLSAYSALSPELKALVDQGRIQVGMPMDAVYIAWGKPAQVLRSETPAGAQTVWLYEGAWLETGPAWAHRTTGRTGGIQPVVVQDYYARSYVSAEIIFVDGKVFQWRTLPQPVY
jgi:hypothetical protein